MDVGQKYSGSISASMNMAGQVGSFISSVAFGYAVDYLRHHHYSTYEQFNLPIYPLAGMLLISGILFLRIDPTRSVTELESEAAPRPLAPATV
jgi:MFS transporter, ACS family, glucarate transporter